MELSIKLKNDLNTLNSVLASVYQFLTDLGLDEKTVQKVIISLDEILSDTIKYAYPKGEEGDIIVDVKSDFSNVEITVKDFGQPFDFSKYQYSKEKALQGDFRGSGFKVVKEFMDDFIFINKGREGKEFRIVKKLPYVHIKDRYERDTSKREEYTGLYQIAPVREEDAEDISKLIYRAYGLTYIKDELYYPEKIKEALRANKKFGVVVKTKDGETVGYFAVLRSRDSNIGEVGEAVVDPDHRGKGIMTVMMKALIDMSKYKGLLGLFGEAVTVHTISQKVNAKFNFKSTALLLGMFPYVEWKGFKQKKQRISVMIDYLPLVQEKKLERYLPKQYAAILKDIYVELGVDVVNKPFKSEELPEKTKLDLLIDYEKGFALFVVGHFGKDFLNQIENQLSSLIEKDIKYIGVDLPLDEPYVKQVIQPLKEEGFIFGGLMPKFHQERDFLRMQMVREDIDPNYVFVYSDIGKKIKNKVFKEFKVAKDKLLSKCPAG